MRSQQLILVLSRLLTVIIYLNLFNSGFNSSMMKKCNSCMRRVCPNEDADSVRSYVNTAVSVSNCFFKRQWRFQEYGGVIYVSGGSYSMSVSNSMFYNCMSTKGGAIYFQSYSSSLSSVCANSCNSNDNLGHFAYIESSNNNHISYLSASLCSSSCQGGFAVRLYLGGQKLDFSNLSMNYADSYSGIGFNSPSSFSSSYCSFSNNKVTNMRCIYFGYCTGSMIFSNIVHNNSPQHGVVSSSSGSANMEYCIFDDNSNTLFSVESGSFSVLHCFVSHSGPFSNSCAISSTYNTTILERRTYKLQFFRSFYCYTDIPLPDQTPEISAKKTLDSTPKFSPAQTPYQTPESTPMVSPNETPFQTPQSTPMITPIETPFQSPIQSPESTPIITPIETPIATIPRTYDPHCSCKVGNMIELKVIFALSSALVIINI